jgi:DNA polymerase
MENKDDLSQALLTLAGDVKRDLRFWESLGITEYGEFTPRELTKPEPVAVVAEVVAPPPLSAASVIPTPEPVILSEESAMPSQKKSTTSAAQVSLFGDLIPAAAPAGPEPELPTDETLEIIRADIGDCTRCKLHPQRTHIVYGEGNPRAQLMFVGEGPGADEDATGRPFVGRAGQLLDRMIEAIGLKREEVYIANVVLCRPPGNREPEPDEVATCEPFLYRQINVIKPKLVVALGGVATKTLLRTKAPISKLRGRFFDFRGTKLLPTFHPAFLLRSPNMKKEAWEDLKKVRDFLQGKIAE